MGRQVEQTMLQVAEMHATAEGADRVQATLVPTSKNMPCLRYWQQSGWQAESEHTFVWRRGDRPTMPVGIEVVSSFVATASR
jgi:predicted enzyme involved in methoxymalonyl-ACP biosynthesis